ncbi:MAG TPA: protein kinase [Candidatus Binatia bacterium]|nr:protein kinase [Candidatus Binatia bacterium]
MSPNEPRRLGRYELLELLGHGAMGVVYKAHDSFLDRTVAVKTYRQDVPITDQVRKRFEREVRTASKLNHPNIVVVHDGGLEQDVPYLAMEYVEGPTLAAELTRRGRLPTAEALALIEEVAEGLAYAHAHGVVHRDLKPANILLAGGTPKIADFGVAKLMTAEATATTMPVGTPSYMAPEQIEGKSIDARTDVFALAILAYELLTGKAPFAGEGWTAVMFQIMNVEPEPPSKVDPSLPVAVDDVIGRALAKDPARRTADAATFSRELREAFAPPKPVVPPAASMPKPAKREEHAPLDAGAFEVFRDLAPKTKDPSVAGPAILVVLLLTAVLAMVIHYRGSRRALVVAQATPLAEAPSAPTVAPIVPTVAPPPTARPTARPIERPTAPPRIEPTSPPRLEPTQAPRVEPTVARRIEPTLPPPPPPAAAPRPRAPELATRERPPVAAPPEAMPPSAPVASSKPTIDVISDPPGAEVIVNGAAKGRTPLRVADLEPGNYDFEIRKEGHNAYRKTIELEPNSDYQMKATLPETVNSLRVLSEPPGVAVKVNGEPKGRAPVTLSQLPNGHYQVTGELEGYAGQTIGVDLKNGELQEVRFRFGAAAAANPANP